MSDRTKLSEKDAALFRQRVGPVRRLVHDRVEHAPRRPRPIPRLTHEGERGVLRDMLSEHYDPADLETGDELLFARPGLQRRLLTRLRRGQFSVKAELDLHGMSVAQAREALVAFLRECRLGGIRCVRIIHGKGLGSHRGQPILKVKLAAWLRQRDEVLAYCSARRVDGGTGAVYVLLKL